MAEKPIIARGLPEGTTVLERPSSDDEKSVELALEAARLGASLDLVRAIGGDEAVAIVADKDNGDDMIPVRVA